MWYLRKFFSLPPIVYLMKLEAFGPARHKGKASDVAAGSLTSATPALKPQDI